MKNYLPLGTIVLLKEGTKTVMIYGRRQIDAETGDIYDYVACLFPEGNISADYTFLFNHEDVREIIFTGYTNKEDEIYLAALNDLD